MIFLIAICLLLCGNGESMTVVEKPIAGPVFFWLHNFTYLPLPSKTPKIFFHNVTISYNSNNDSIVDGEYEFYKNFTKFRMTMKVFKYDEVKGSYQYTFRFNFKDCEIQFYAVLMQRSTGQQFPMVKDGKKCFFVKGRQKFQTNLSKYYASMMKVKFYYGTYKGIIKMYDKRTIVFLAESYCSYYPAIHNSDGTYKLIAD